MTHLALLSLGLFFFLLLAFALVGMGHILSTRYNDLALQIKGIQASTDIMLERQEQFNQLLVALVENS